MVPWAAQVGRSPGAARPGPNSSLAPSLWVPPDEGVLTCSIMTVHNRAVLFIITIKSKIKQKQAKERKY